MYFLKKKDYLLSLITFEKHLHGLGDNVSYFCVTASYSYQVRHEKYDDASSLVLRLKIINYCPSFSLCRVTISILLSHIWVRMSLHDLQIVSLNCHLAPSSQVYLRSLSLALNCSFYSRSFRDVLIHKGGGGNSQKWLFPRGSGFPGDFTDEFFCTIQKGREKG